MHKTCLDCGKAIDYPTAHKYRGRCQDCGRANWRRQRSRTWDPAARERNRFYARKGWRMTRKRKLFLNPLCEYAEQDGEPCGAIAEHVHHKVDLADGGAPYELDNLMSICKPHHSQITRGAAGGGFGERS